MDLSDLNYSRTKKIPLINGQKKRKKRQKIRNYKIPNHLNGSIKVRSNNHNGKKTRVINLPRYNFFSPPEIKLKIKSDFKMSFDPGGGYGYFSKKGRDRE